MKTVPYDFKSSVMNMNGNIIVNTDVPLPFGVRTGVLSYVVDRTEENTRRLVSFFHGDILCLNDITKEWFDKIITKELKKPVPSKEEERSVIPVPEMKINLWKHQERAYQFMAAEDYGVLRMGMGTGKTASVVAYLSRDEVRKAIVICPQSVIPVWQHEVNKFSLKRIPVILLNRGNSFKKAGIIDKFYREEEKVVFVLNYESFWRTDIAMSLMNKFWDLLIFDESHALKGHQTKQSLFAAALSKKCRKRFALTGTFLPNGCPMEAFGQFRALHEKVLGNNYWRFESQYAVLKDVKKKIKTPNGYCLKTVAKKIVGYKNEEKLKEKFKKHSYLVPMSVVDLPPFREMIIEVCLSKSVLGHYINLENDLKTELENGVSIKSYDAMTLVMKLQQLTSGFAKDVDGNIQELGVEKKTALYDLLNSTAEKVVVFCRFHHDLEAIREVAERSGKKYGEVSGRKKDLVKGAYPAGKNVLGVQIQAGGEGINLSIASIGIFFNELYSMGKDEQAVRRLVRKGMGNNTIIYYLIASRSIDGKIHQAVAQKKSLAAFFT